MISSPIIAAVVLFIVFGCSVMAAAFGRTWPQRALFLPLGTGAGLLLVVGISWAASMLLFQSEICIIGFNNICL